MVQPVTVAMSASDGCAFQSITALLCCRRTSSMPMFFPAKRR